jgi:seryl-tRNA synthetase
MQIIDYKLLSKAIKYYKKKGFTQIEVPWRVSAEAINATFDSNLSFKAGDKFLIGSAEQGFLELILQNNLKNNMLMSISPCFRNDAEDELHQQEFVKLELIYLSKFNISNTDIEYIAFSNFVIDFITKKLKIQRERIQIVQTFENSIYSEDILIDGIEYGSYGIRKFKDYNYIYGTGIALPRASIILEKEIK